MIWFKVKKKVLTVLSDKVSEVIITLSIILLLY